MSADGWFCGCGHRLAIPDVCPLCGWACDSAGRVTPTNTPPLPPAPEPVAAPVEGFRVWRVHRDDHVTLTRALVQRLYDDHEAGRNPFRALLPGARLHPVASATGPWERVQHAVCVRGGMSASSASYMPVAPPHEAPQRGCQCGLWALKDEQEAHRIAAEYQLGAGYAVGKLRLWGRVVEHTRGYRGQHAQPLELTYVGDGPDAEETAAELAAFYGCPCALQAPAEPTLGEWGTVVSKAQLARFYGAANLQTFITTNVTNSGLAAQLVQQQSAANNAALAYMAGTSAPYDRGGRRAWPVRFARWIMGSASAAAFAVDVLLIAGPVIATIVGAVVLRTPWVLFGCFLSPAWISFSTWAKE